MRRAPGNPVPAMLSLVGCCIFGALSGVPAAEGQPDPGGGCTPRTLAGGVICVCLEGPVAAPRDTRLLLDGRPAGAPVAGTPDALFFRLSPDVPLGEHPAGLAGSAEGSPADRPTASCTVQVLGIHAQLDRERIWRGQGTPLRIRIEGTREPVRLRLINETPGGVHLEGGADQEVSTSGGRKNTVERRVRGVNPGDFDIVYELLGASCPCAQYPGDGVFTGGGGTSGSGPGTTPDAPGGTTPGPGEGTGGEGPSMEDPPVEDAPVEGVPGEEIPGGGTTPQDARPPTGGEPPPTETPPTETPPTERPSTERPSTETPPPVDRPTVPLPSDQPVITPGPEEPPPRPCASIGEEIDKIEERYRTLTEEMDFETVPRPTVVEPEPTAPPPVTRPTVVQTGPTGHPYCDLTYTTWARGAQAVSIHRLMTQVQDLADFCLGQGTCTPEGHAAYVERLSALASTLRSDGGFTAVAREMPGLAESLLAEYRHELGKARGELGRLGDGAGDAGAAATEGTSAGTAPEAGAMAGARAYRLRQAERRVRSWQRSVEDMLRWRRWSLQLVAALEEGDLLTKAPARERAGSRDRNAAAPTDPGLAASRRGSSAPGTDSAPSREEISP